MRILIAEDDMISRKILFKFLERYGECDLVVDGLEALDAFLLSIKDGNPYDLICLDIMMPKLDGLKVLKSIIDIEQQKTIPLEKRSKIVMTTALTDVQLVQNAFEIGCDAYAAKPIDIAKLVEVLSKFGFEQHS
ncbi:MAG TPA: response regulator [Lachnospiraceae bacterium]|nr:response regulator [Lachnospiraceae bacterium]